MFELWGRSTRGNLAFEQLDDINMHKHALVSALIVISMCVCVSSFQTLDVIIRKRTCFFPIVSNMIQNNALKEKKKYLLPGIQAV